MTGADIVVVGGGITGLSVAFFLAEAGCKVLVLERSGIAAGASGIQPGGVRQQWSTRVNCLLAGESMVFYQELDERLAQRVDATLDPCGYVFLAHSEAVLDGLRENVQLQNEVGVRSRIISPDDARTLVPGLETESVVGASWCADDGYFDRPQTVVEAFGSAARERGARIQIAEARAVTATNGGWKVETNESLIYADHVVLAAGCATVDLLEPLDVHAPIAPAKRHLFLSEPVSERLLEPLVVSGELHFAAKHLKNGRVLASDLSAAGDPSENREAWRRTISRAIEQLLPILSYVTFPILATGTYDLTPDHQPLVGAIPGHDGLWIAAGYSGHGFMLAPAISNRLAGAIGGSHRDELLEGFAPDRFSNATEIERQIETQVV